MILFDATDLLPGFGERSQMGVNNPPLPRNIPRSAWTVYQHELRARNSREDQGLPQHPNGTGWVDCPECDGSGEVIENTSYNNDPQCEVPHYCPRCMGDGGKVDGLGKDPLVELRAQRIHSRRKYSYTSARKRAMRPVAGMAQAEMLANATRCETRADEGVAYWRQAVAE